MLIQGVTSHLSQWLVRPSESSQQTNSCTTWSQIGQSASSEPVPARHHATTLQATIHTEESSPALLLHRELPLGYPWVRQSVSCEPSHIHLDPYGTTERHRWLTVTHPELWVQTTPGLAGTLWQRCAAGERPTVLSGTVTTGAASFGGLLM